MYNQETPGQVDIIAINPHHFTYFGIYPANDTDNPLPYLFKFE